MIKKTVETLKLQLALTEGLIMLNKLLEKRQAKYDNASDRWLESDAGCDYSDDNDNLETLVNSLEETLSSFEDVFE